MKGIALVLFGLLGVLIAVNGSIDHDGQPGCKTSDEVSTGKYRNIWDPTHYWECKQINVAAERARCPDQQGFDPSKRTCVSWNEWVWVEPIEPPSRP